MEVPYFIKSRDRTDESLMPEVTVLCASLLFSRSVLCVGDWGGRTGGLTMASGRRAKETERVQGALFFNQKQIRLLATTVLFITWTKSTIPTDRKFLPSIISSHHFLLASSYFHPLPVSGPQWTWCAQLTWHCWWSRPVAKRYKVQKRSLASWRVSELGQSWRKKW